MCEQLGQEPDPTKMPLDSSDFPEEVQVAFFVCNCLSDQWDGMNGSYMGKDWSEVDYVFTLYEIENPKIVYYFANMVVVFCQLLMADEINRASPRTQSALLQAMQEKTVTVAGDTRPLGVPFHVLATQNPLENAGTYSLPEAQLDRFLFHLIIKFI